MTFYGLKRGIRFFIQRRIRGWDDSECWSLDHTFAEWIVPRLEVLKKNKQGIPQWCFIDDKWDHTDEEFNDAEKVWNGVIDAMIFGFKAKAEQYKEGGAWDNYEDMAMAVLRTGKTFPPFNFTYPPYQLAKELFAKHLDDLWN